MTDDDEPVSDPVHDQALQAEMFDLLAAAMIEEHQHGLGPLYDLELDRIKARILRDVPADVVPLLDLSALDALLRTTVSTVNGSLCWSAAMSEEDAGQFIADFIDETRTPRSQ